jgi:hypothetical protein
MARNIQSQSGQPQSDGATFLRLLVGAVGWVVAATLVPFPAIMDDFPALAPYADWAPILFYVLAFWTFTRALTVLQRIAKGRTTGGIRGRKAGSRASSGALPSGDKPAAEARRAKSSSGLPVNHTPTVQRMR